MKGYFYRIWDPTNKHYFQPSKEPWRWRTVYDTAKMAATLMRDGDTDSTLLIVVDENDKPVMEVRK